MTDEETREYNRRRREKRKAYWMEQVQACPDCGKEFRAPAPWKCCRACRARRQQAGRDAAMEARGIFRDEEPEEEPEAKEKPVRKAKKREIRMDEKEMAALHRRLDRKPTEVDLAVHEVEEYNRQARAAGRPALSYGQYFSQLQQGKITGPHGHKGSAD